MLRYSSPEPGGQPVKMVATSTHLWVAMLSNFVYRVARVAPDGTWVDFDLRRSPRSIAAAPDGVIWVGCDLELARINLDGTIDYFPYTPTNVTPNDIVVGPDGAIWFTDIGKDSVGRIVPGDPMQLFSLGAGSGPRAITVGPDGALWVARSGNGGVTRLATDGTKRDFQIGGRPEDIATGPDGKLWVNYDDTRVASITTAGNISSYVTTRFMTTGIVSGGGKLWAFTSFGYVQRIDPVAGALEWHNIGSPGAGTYTGAWGPDGQLWFVSYWDGAIGRLDLDGTADIDLEVRHTADKETADPGTELNYSIDVFNHGPGTASSVLVSIRLGSVESFESLTTPPGWQCGEPVVDPSRGFTPIIRCTGVDMPPAATPVSFALRTIAHPLVPAFFQNRVWVDAPQEESDFTVNHSAETITTTGLTASVTGRNWICPGGSTELTVTARTASPPVTYAWYKDGHLIPGASADKLVATAAGSYMAWVTDAAEAHAAAYLSVSTRSAPLVAISAPPQVCSEPATALSVEDAGAGATYQWSVTNGTITEGTGTRSVTVLPRPGALSVTVSVTVTATGCASSGVASVTLPVKNCIANNRALIAREGQTATLLSNGKILFAGGLADHRTVAELSAAEVFDPLTGRSQRVGDMSIPRYTHTATLLRDGTVLIAGGASHSTGTRSAEIFDPASGSFRTLPLMRAYHMGHSATLLDDGRVLIAGTAGDRLTEYYIPATEMFMTAGYMQVSRYEHTATLLPDKRVLIVGGRNSVDFGGTATAEIFDPATGLYTLTGSMKTGRFVHTATLLADGRVLVAGGWSATGILATTEIYDPATGTFSDGPRLQYERSYHTATLLPDGRIALVGGQYFEFPRAVEVFDPATSTFSTPAQLQTGRWQHTSTLLPDGRICVAAGMTSSYVSLDSFELIALGEGGDFNDGEPLPSERGRHSASMLPDGNVLFAGGFNGAGQSLQTTEIFDGLTGRFRHGTPIGTARGGHSATPLVDGRIVLAGGESSAGAPLSGIELYESTSETFSAGPPLATARTGHTATSLSSGEVLYVGGKNASALASSELFDPILNRVAAGPSLAVAREGHTATLLPDGSVLVTGGSNGGPPLASAEVYDPVTRTFRAVGSMTSPRMAHTASLLPSGKVLISGGWNGSIALATSEIFDPVSGSFTAGPVALHSRMRHLATVLPSGFVLVAGGVSGATAVAEAELFDPALLRFSAAGTMSAPRAHHTATLLLNGTVLFAGGGNGGSASYTSSAEIWDPGLGFVEARRPQVSSVTQSLRIGDAVIASGDRFRGDSEASGSASGAANSSATNYPLVQLQRLDSDQIVRPLLDGTVGWSVDALKTAAIAGVPGGVYRMSVITNGVPSRQEIVMLDRSCETLLEAPAAITVVQTTCDGGGGATSGSSAAIATFLSTTPDAARCISGGSALPPLVGGAEATASTMFPLGSTNVTFRWRDAAGVVVSSTSIVRVLPTGDLDADGRKNSVDLVILANYLVRNVQQGRPPFNAPALAADVNGDGLVNAIDLVVLANQLVGNIGCIEGQN